MSEDLELGETLFDASLEQRIQQSDHDALGDTVDVGPPQRFDTSQRTTVDGSSVRTTILPRVSGDVDSSQGIELTASQRLRYEPLDSLGVGGMGEVLLARDHDIERDIALKRLKPGGQSSAALLRFIDEIKTIGRLEHPGIVPIHDVGIDEHGSYFFVMKRLHGETLEDIIEGLERGDPNYHAKYTYSVRAQLAMDILQAMRFAHDHDIIHRDLKPANIMVGPYGEVVILDWGLAKEVGAPERSRDDLEQDQDAGEGSTSSARLKLTQYGEILGTPAYMSPEQAKGEHDRVDQRSDIYALGVVFYELFTLEHYLDDCKSLVEILREVCEREPIFPANLKHDIQGTIPAEYAHFLSEALSKDPAERYQSLDEMVHKLQLAMSGKFAVQCRITNVRHNMNTLSDWANNHYNAAVALSVAAPVMLLAMSVLSVIGLISLLG